MLEREKLIENYFNSWIKKDISLLERTFAEDIYYSESWGPEYFGLQKVKYWFSEWTQRASVIKWEIKGFIHQNNQTAVEWYFQCDDSGLQEFDGVSLIEFNNSGKITSLKEFGSKLPHYDPYEDISV